MHLEQTRNIPREIAEAGRLSHLFLPWVAPARRYSTRPPLPLVILAERGDALQHLPRLGFWQASETVAGCCPVFSTGQSVRPGPGPGRTALCRPVQSFSELARQVRAKDQDGRHCVVPRRLPVFSAAARRPLPEIVSHREARRS